MRSLAPGLQAHLDEGTTTLAWCWRIVRADGLTFGFTDHDQPLVFDGTIYEPESGFTASELRSSPDLSADAQDAEGVLRSDRITEIDILDGRWDNAEVEVWRVNWQATSQRVLMRRGAIGQIRRGRLAFARPRARADGRADLPGELRRGAGRRALRRRSGGSELQEPRHHHRHRRRPRLHRLRPRRLRQRLVHARHRRVDERCECGPAHGGGGSPRQR